MEFLKFEDGDKILGVRESHSAIDFILSGRVRRTYTLEKFPIFIDEILGKGAMFGALNLYGMTTSSPALTVSIGRVSLMRMEKSQYMNLLLTDKIYILNFVNYLSAAAQKSPDWFLHIGEASIGRTLKSLAYSIVSRGAETIMVAGKDEDLAKYCGVDITEFNEWKSSELAHNRIIANQRGIILKSPHLLR